MMGRDQQIEHAIEFLGNTYKITDANHKDWKALIFIQSELKRTKYSAKAIRQAIDETIESSPRFLPTVASIKNQLKITGAEEDVGEWSAEQKDDMTELYEFACYYSIHINKEYYPDPMMCHNPNTFNSHLEYMKSLDYCKNINFIKTGTPIKSVNDDTLNNLRRVVYTKAKLYCQLKNIAEGEASKTFKPYMPDPSIFSMKLPKLKDLNKEYSIKLDQLKN